MWPGLCRLSRRWSRAGGARSGDDGRADALLLRARRAVVATNRAALRRGRRTRVICANRAPDDTTFARFGQRHEIALADVFGEVLMLCAEAGLVEVGVIAIDGTKVHANASERATRDYEQIAREILAEADAIDREEDERFGERRGDELPEHLATGAGRAKWLAEANDYSNNDGPRRPGQFRPHARSGCGRPSAVWRKSSRASVAPTRPLRSTAPAG
jgi:hypothetical protein